MVKFSVIIPTFNRNDSLRRTLESVAGQTYKSFEVIVADDGSSDGTDIVVDEFKDRFKLRYLWEPNWGGPARPRNRAVAVASGEWLAFLDSDDLWHPDRLASLVQFLDVNDVVYHALEELDQDGLKVRTIDAPQIDQSSPFLDLILNGNRLANSATCVRREVFNRFGGVREDRAIIAVEDYDLWLRLAKGGCKFKAIDTVLGSYVVGHDNISVLSDKFINALRTVVELNSVGLGFYNRKRAMQFTNYIFGMRELQSSRRGMASKFFVKCIFGVPSIISLKASARLVLAWVH